jgi:hypothetical protein
MNWVRGRAAGFLEWPGNFMKVLVCGIMGLEITGRTGECRGFAAEQN